MPVQSSYLLKSGSNSVKFFRKNVETTKNKKIFFTLWALCILGSWAILPYTYYLEMLPPSVSLGAIFLSTTIQSILFYGIICWVCSKILLQTDLHPFPEVRKENFLPHIGYPALAGGILAGLILFVSNATLFKNSHFNDLQLPPIWARTVASLYGAINEEVLLRLFLFTLIYFLIGKWVKIREKNRMALLWSTNVLVALLFGIGHLPAAFKLTTPSSFNCL